MIFQNRENAEGNDADTEIAISNLGVAMLVSPETSRKLW